MSNADLKLKIFEDLNRNRLKLSDKSLDLAERIYQLTETDNNVKKVDFTLQYDHALNGSNSLVANIEIYEPMHDVNHFKKYLKDNNLHSEGINIILGDKYPQNIGFQTNGEFVFEAYFSASNSYKED